MLVGTPLNYTVCKCMELATIGSKLWVWLHTIGSQLCVGVAAYNRKSTVCGCGCTHLVL